MNPSPELVAVLERARRLGVLGPGPVSDHLVHAQGYLAALAGLEPGAVVVDLGSGAGIPGLVVAEARPDLEVVLLDAMEKRTALLAEAVLVLGAAGRIRVVTARAEVAGRDPSLRGRVQAVTARSFGPPATTAECAAPLLAVGGRLVVSEPPDRPDRWPADPLAELGLVDEADAPEGLRVLRQVTPCPGRFPRRNGLPAKRPLFT